jgi:DNA replication and repair protein RecF
MKRLQKDKLTGNTSGGPHKDELRIMVDGKNAREFASWGQARISSIVLLNAMSQSLHKSTGKTPSIFLDDCFAELDQAKTDRLLELSPEWGQIFIAAPKDVKLPVLDYAMFRFEAPGNVFLIDEKLHV